ncbi:MAG: hypothetical protein ACK5D5_03580 [Bacteroidota bacterium]|jgi:hypothetical protein
MFLLEPIKINRYIALLFIAGSLYSFAQIKDSIIPAPILKNNLRYNLSEDGKNYFQITFLNQVWTRLNESNPGTTLFGSPAGNTFDIGLRRTRIQMFGQINDRTFLYFQFGQNNFNNTFASSPVVVSGNTIYGNRKLAPFFHDALCEFKVIKGKQGNALKVGAGLTIMNGLSRFSQPSVSTIMTTDVPVFLQYSVDQIDEFDRRLAVYARGQIGKLDYRFYLSNPFPISSSGTTPAPLDTAATFVNYVGLPQSKNPGLKNQIGGMITWNFFENENHSTPYMTGTYLGTKKVFNISVGSVYQQSATWYLGEAANGLLEDTMFSDMKHIGLEAYLDMPVNKDRQTAINAFAGYYLTNYGPNYLRYNGLMNPATGFGSSTTNYIQKNSFGNAFPMFGTGSVMYMQFGFLLPKNLLGQNNGQLLPYVSTQISNYDALPNKKMFLINSGINWLIKGHNSKISFDWQNRPTFYKENTVIKSSSRKNSFIIQYQIFI